MHWALQLDIVSYKHQQHCTGHCHWTQLPRDIGSIALDIAPTVHHSYHALFQCQVSPNPCWPQERPAMAASNFDVFIYQMVPRKGPMQSCQGSRPGASWHSYCWNNGLGEKLGHRGRRPLPRHQWPMELTTLRSWQALATKANAQETATGTC